MRLIIRSDTRSGWMRVNPIIAENELVYDSTQGDFKRGDGVTSYLLLPYLIDAKSVYRGEFVSGTYYQIGHVVEALDGDAYRSRRNMTALAQPVAGSSWKKLNWFGTGTGTGSPMEGSTITRWEPKEYTRDLDVVLFENNLYYVSDDTPRPFLSEDFADEYDLGLWTLIGGGSGVTPVDESLLLLAEDGRKITDENGLPITVD